MRDIHHLAAFVHGALCALHGLGIAYGIKRRNWVDTAVHIGAGVFSLRATTHHLREAR